MQLYNYDESGYLVTGFELPWWDQWYEDEYAAYETEALAKQAGLWCGEMTGATIYLGPANPNYDPEAGAALNAGPDYPMTEIARRPKSKKKAVVVTHRAPAPARKITVTPRHARHRRKGRR